MEENDERKAWGKYIFEEWVNHLKETHPELGSIVDKFELVMEEENDMIHDSC
jgi:hypothetical protein